MSQFSSPSSCYEPNGQPTPEFRRYIDGLIKGPSRQGSRAFDALPAPTKPTDQDRALLRDLRDLVFGGGDRQPRQRDAGPVQPVKAASAAPEPIVNQDDVIFAISANGHPVYRKSFGARRPVDQKKLTDYYSRVGSLEGRGIFRAIEEEGEKGFASKARPAPPNRQKLGPETAADPQRGGRYGTTGGHLLNNELGRRATADRVSADQKFSSVGARRGAR